MARRIPILAYHTVAADAPRPHRAFALTPDAFRAHLELIRNGGYETLTVSDVVQGLRRPEDLPERPVALTFDDGFADMHRAVLPLLAERGMTATAFVPTASVRARSTDADWRHLSVTELRELAANGIEIGSHTHTHIELDLARTGDVTDEVTRSKSVLEDTLEMQVLSLAYPYGYSSPTVRELVAKAGYSAACGVRHALSSTDDDPFDLARVRMLRRTGTDALGKWLTGTGIRTAPCPERAITRVFRPVRRARRIMGWHPPSWSGPDEAAANPAARC